MGDVDQGCVGGTVWHDLTFGALELTEKANLGQSDQHPSSQITLEFGRPRSRDPLVLFRLGDQLLDVPIGDDQSAVPDRRPVSEDREVPNQYVAQCQVVKDQIT